MIASVCGTDGRPAGRQPPGADAARRRRDRRAPPTPPPRGSPRERYEGRDAHLLGEAARRASCTRSRSPRRSRGAATTVELMALARPGEGLFRATPLPVRIVRHVADRRAVRRAHRGDARGLHRRPAAAAGRRRPRHRPRPGLPVGQRRAGAARRGRDRARDPHRAPRRRVHLAVADRVPGPLDHRPRPRAVRLAAVGRAAAHRVRRQRRPRPQRRRHAPLPAAARRRRARRRAPPRRASRAASRC